MDFDAFGTLAGSLRVMATWRDSRLPAAGVPAKVTVGLKTWDAVTGMDGSFTLELPLGKAEIHFSPEDIEETWIGLDYETEVDVALSNACRKPAPSA